MLTYFVLSLKLFIVSLTIDTLSKAIMDPSSVQHFCNIVSVTRGWGGGGGWGVHSSCYQVPEIVW